MVTWQLYWCFYQRQWTVCTLLLLYWILMWQWSEVCWFSFKGTATLNIHKLYLLATNFLKISYIYNQVLLKIRGLVGKVVFANSVFVTQKLHDASKLDGLNWAMGWMKNSSQQQIFLQTPTHLPVYWVLWHMSSCKQLEFITDHLPPSSAKVNNVCRCTVIRAHAFMAWWLLKQRAWLSQFGQWWISAYPLC